MPRGKSGRIVIEIDLLRKSNLYTILASENITLKEWFVDQCDKYIADFSKSQLPLKK